MRVALYARVSSDEQAKHGLSLEAQMHDLRTWAEENEHTVTGEYIDAGISGRKPLSKRPALLQFAQDLESGTKVDALVFIKLDRFFRSVKLYYQAMDVLDKYHVSWVTTQESYETVSSQGKFVVNLMLSIAEAESSRTGDRVKFVIDRKIAKGEKVGYKPPIGYSVVDKHLVPNEEAPVIRQTFRTFLDSGSVVAAMDYLHSNGHTLIYNSTYRLLTNPIYKGSLRGNDSYCTGIVPVQEFEEAQSMLGKRSVRDNPTGRIYLFSGLLQCGECGRLMTGHYQGSSREGKQYRYRCNGHYQDHLCGNKHYVTEGEIEDIILSRIESEAGLMFTTIKPKKKKKPVNNSKKLERLTELYVDGMISREEYRRRRDALTVVDSAPSESRVDRTVFQGNIRENYSTLTRQEKRSFWRNILERVVVNGQTAEVTFRD